MHPNDSVVSKEALTQIPSLLESYDRTPYTRSYGFPVLCVCFGGHHEVQVYVTLSAIRGSCPVYLRDRVEDSSSGTPPPPHTHSKTVNTKHF